MGGEAQARKSGGARREFPERPRFTRAARRACGTRDRNGHMSLKFCVLACICVRVFVRIWTLDRHRLLRLTTART